MIRRKYILGSITAFLIALFIIVETNQLLQKDSLEENVIELELEDDVEESEKSDWFKAKSFDNGNDYIINKVHALSDLGKAASLITRFLNVKSEKLSKTPLAILYCRLKLSIG